MKNIEPRQNPVAPADGRLPQELPAEEPNVREYWYVIYRHRRPMLVFFLLTLLVTIAAIPWGNRVYTASTTLHIPSQSRGILDAPEGSNLQTNYYETQRRLLRSRSLVAQVIMDLDLAANPAFIESSQSLISRCMKAARRSVAALVDWLAEYFSDASSQSSTAGFELKVSPALVERYLAQLVVEPIPESQLVQLKFISASPTLSKTVANAHAATFISRNLVTRFELTAETRQFLEKKLAELKNNVENSERALNQFQREHEIASVDKGGNLILEQLKKLNSDLTEARSKRIEIESLHRIVQKGEFRNLTQIIENPNIQHLRKQIATLETQLAHLSQKFKSTYPGIISLQQEIVEAKARVDEEVKRISRTIERDYGAARAKEAALAVETERARRVALDLQEKAVDYAVLEREVASNRALYEAVFKKTKEATLTAEDPMPNLRVVDRAEIPLVPDTAQWKMMLPLGLALGAFGAVGLAFLVNIFDSSLRTPEDVARDLHLSTLGIVPDIKKLANGHAHELGYTTRFLSGRAALQAEITRNTQALVSHHPLSLMAEMYRSIVTAILFSKPDKPPRTILVTSSRPDEGKTVTAVNLAIVLAQSYGPVLMVDADLRGGHCHRLLGLSNGIGLSNVLTGNADVENVIKKTRLKDLSLLGRGKLPPNPADLLGSQKMQDTLHQLASAFRFIVIDSAPLLPVSDTVLLAPKVEGVVLVARGEEVSRQLVRKARERLEYVDARILGVVLNGINIWSPEYSEYRQVYQSHYARYARNGNDELRAVVATANEIREVIPPAFFDYVIQVLTEAVGPMGSIIVYDQIAALGESGDAFPRARLNEFLAAIAKEISDDARKAAFQRQMRDELERFNSV